MNICMFTNTYLPHVGGVARSVDLFAKDLRRMGHRVLIIAPTFPGTDPGPQKGQDVLRLPAIQNFNGSDFSVGLPLPVVIENSLDKFGPELIHSHHPFLLGDSALRGARKRNIPLVFTHHTMYERYTHYVPFNSKVMQRLAVHLSTDYANLCTRVIAPSQSVARLLRRRGVKTPIHEVPTGVDSQALSQGIGTRLRQRFGLPTQAFLIGHLGRLAPEKNLAFLSQAAVKAIQMLPGREVYFLLVGAGPSQEAIKKVFFQAGLQDRLLETGQLTGQDLSDALAAMDVFAFASKTETQGMVLIEAMAARTPVLALDAPGVREVVQDGYNGRLLRATSSSADLAQALAELVRSPASLLSALGQRALLTAKELDRRNCAKRLLEVYALARQDSLYPKPGEQLTAWEQLRQRLKTEWELLTQKASAGANAVTEDSRTDIDLR